MVVDLDGETLDPRTPLPRTQEVPYLRQVFDGGAPRVVDVPHRLVRGRTVVGRGSESGPGRIGLTDQRVSRDHAEVRVVESAGGTARASLKNLSRFGTLRGGEAIVEGTLLDGDVLRLGDSILVYRAAPGVLADRPSSGDLLGVSPAIAELRRNVGLVAPTSATVLVLGPTGSGKEVVASEIHRRSGRKGPLVAVNCSAIPEALAESQLFGHRAGAFSGASRDHPGYFEQAQGGTLYLDELGELPLELQPKLLRVLDERKVTPVGATRAIDLDVRVVAATNRPLRAEVEAGRFRGDLYARLAELVLHLPPLCERAEDILLLFAHALGEEAPALEPDLAWALTTYGWPFNVRELIKVATEASVRGAGQGVLRLSLVEDRLEEPRVRPAPSPSSPRAGAPSAVDRDERPPPSRDELQDLLRLYKGVLADVARDTGRSRKQVYRWLQRHGLDPDAFRDDAPGRPPGDDD